MGFIPTSPCLLTCPSNKTFTPSSCAPLRYAVSGFLALQTALIETVSEGSANVSSIAVQQVCRADDTRLSFTILQFPKFAFTLDTSASFQPSLILFLQMAFSPLLQSLLVTIVGFVPLVEALDA